MLRALNRLSSILALLGMAAGAGTGCAPGIPEVWVQFQEDDTFPCLGGAQMKVEVWENGQLEKQFVESGVFFNGQNQHCEIPEFRYSDLPQGLEFELMISLFDSTRVDPSANPQGLLGQGKSFHFNVEGGNWIKQLSVKLGRNLPASEPGTLVVKQPADWETLTGVKRLACQILQGTTAKRDTFIEGTVDPKQSPFPLFVSGIPLTGSYDLTITALDAANSTLRSWKRTGITMDTGKLWSVEIQ